MDEFKTLIHALNFGNLAKKYSIKQLPVYFSEEEDRKIRYRAFELDITPEEFIREAIIEDLTRRIQAREQGGNHEV